MYRAVLFPFAEDTKTSRAVQSLEGIDGKANTMDKLAQALDALEAHGLASPLGNDETGQAKSAAYLALHGDLSRLVIALSAMGGDHARVGQVIEHLMHGADAVTRHMPPAAASSPQNSL